MSDIDFCPIHTCAHIRVRRMWKTLCYAAGMSWKIDTVIFYLEEIPRVGKEIGVG